ncbi:MAG: ABC transporter ATP-binding protein/permease [Deltaproteobacteria bacterium]|nr:ABC transporter ATP-binding protein/permease [Deltaproteobacteria bacterium]
MERFDLVFWRRLWALLKPYWVSDQKNKAFKLLGLVIVLGLVMIGFQAVFSYVNRDLINALQKYEAARFHRLLLLFVVYITAAVAVFPLFPYLTGRLGILWREWMTRQFTDLGFKNHAFYQMNLSGRVDNPDQRIQEDLNTFSSGTLNYALTALSSIVTGATFFGILWAISPLLAWSLIGYSVLGTYAAITMGRRLVVINFHQQRYEADYRFGLVHVRDNAEPIAMYGGEAQETSELTRRFNWVVSNFKLLLRWQLFLGFVTTAFDNSVSLMPWLVLAGIYFAHQIQLGQLTQAAYAFGVVQGALAIVIDQFQSLTSYATVVHRLGTFTEECAAAREAEACAGVGITEGPCIALDNLTLKTPDQRNTLLDKLSANVSDGERLLITGPSGAGKTALMRAIAGLWRTGTGQIVRPPLHDVMFLPQRPYMILGSLRAQLCYPRATGVSDEELRRELNQVNLLDLLDRIGGLDAEFNWPDVLSGGEQQRLAFARLFLNRPRFAFLDEATSALDPVNEAMLYRRLAATPITFVSAGHRESLAEYHDRNLELAGNGSWRLRSLTKQQVALRSGST